MKRGEVLDVAVGQTQRIAAQAGLLTRRRTGRAQHEQPRRSAARPTVTVVIPCYNYGRYLRASVESAVAQEGVEVDVIIVDDASTDETPTVAGQLAQEYPRVRVITHETNAGMIRTFNDGLRAAGGKYALLISADDLLTPGALNRATDLLEHHPEVGMVYGFPRNFTGEPPVARQRVNSWSIWSGDRWTELCLRRSHSIVHSPEAVVRTSVQREVGYYSESLPRCPDYEMWLRFAHVSSIGRVNGPDQAYRRLHELNFTRTVNSGALADLTSRLESIEAFFDRVPRTARTDRLLDRARRSIAIEALSHARQALGVRPADPEAAALVGFAETIDPATVRSREWRSIPQEVANPHLSRPPAARASAVLRPLWRRLTWQRWRATGL